ncbi:MAG: hypothetical protein ACE5HC_16385 [Candidatus Binatia bacterium]
MKVGVEVAEEEVEVAVVEVEEVEVVVGVEVVEVAEVAEVEVPLSVLRQGDIQACHRAVHR